jgi:Raf kinase inhibitor-like YbhB/YbcL family protein
MFSLRFSWSIDDHLFACNPLLIKNNSFVITIPVRNSMKSLVLILSTLILAACTSVSGDNTPTSLPASQEVPMSISLSSPAFSAGASIPVIYTCKGQSISPPLSWNNSPANTTTFALIMDDPDAPMGTFVHWVIFNIPPSSHGLPEAVPSKGQLADGTLQGNNGAGQTGYTGPCPPSGTHRYFFKLYALDNVLSLSSGADKDQLLKVMQGHILAQGELMGTFSK